VLRDPATGPRAISRMPPATTEAERADLEAAIRGDAAAAFRVLARAAPLASPAPASASPASGPSAAAPASSPPPPPAGAPPERVGLEYVAPDGGTRLVTLAREGGAWRVDRFPL